MSVFEAIKDKFQTVQQDLSAGINLIKGHEILTPVARTRTDTDHVNYDAGADLLYKYQTLWKDIQKANEENAKKAEAMDREIQIIYGDIKKNCNNLTGFYREVKSLPSFLSVLQNLTDLLACLEESCDAVESSLVHLENINEAQEMKQHKLSHTEKLNAYQMKKEEDLKKAKDQLCHEHAVLVEKMEKHKQLMLRERSETFEEAFQSDLDFYRTHGRMERLSDSEASKSLELEDITLDQDEAALAAFLASTEVTPCSEKALLGISFSSDVAGDITSPSDVDLLTPMTPGSEWGAADSSSCHSEPEDKVQLEQSDESLPSKQDDSEPTIDPSSEYHSEDDHDSLTMISPSDDQNKTATWREKENIENEDNINSN